MSTADKSQKAAERVLKANNRLARVLAQQEDNKRKRRTGRHLKLGLIVEQFIAAGDSTLAKRMEDAAVQQFGGRKVDRLDFELDEPLNWFDKMREEAVHRRATGEAIGAPTDASLGPKESSKSSVFSSTRGAASGAAPGALAGDAGAVPVTSARPS